MLQTVHTQGRCQHQHQDNENRRQDLIPFSPDYIRDDIQRIIVGIDAEQTENAHHPEHPKGHHSRRKENGKEIGKE